jgi:hypothetical protein
MARFTVPPFVFLIAQNARVFIMDGREFFMVILAQLVRAPGCGPGGHGFDPHRSPHID